MYSEQYKGRFPEDLKELTVDLAKQVGYNNYNPEAATINFYTQAKQTMGGHLDDAEEDLTKPIVSCSFGNTVVFLIGGPTRGMRSYRVL
jgi:alkylated DNA repair protein alkB family protein 1